MIRGAEHVVPLNIITKSIVEVASPTILFPGLPIHWICILHRKSQFSVEPTATS